MVVLINVGSTSFELTSCSSCRSRVAAYFVEACHCDCNVRRNTLTIADMRWKVIRNSVSKVFALAVASYALYDSASHASMIGQDSSVDAVAS